MIVRNFASVLPGILSVLVLFGSQILPAQTNTAQAPYTVSSPDKWVVEHFILPPEFSPKLNWRGAEEVRLHPDWTHPEKDGYWSYVFFWWIEGNAPIDATVLRENLQIYYDGLLNHLAIPHKIPADKIYPSVANVKKIKTKAGDKETYLADVKMLSFMTQLPVTLHVVLHVKDINTTRHTAIRVDASPKSLSHSIWEELHAINISIQPY